MASVTTTDEIPLPPSNPTASVAGSVSTPVANGFMPMVYPQVTAYPAQNYYTDPSYYAAYAASAYQIPQYTPLGSTIQDPIVNATLQASVAGYQYPITTPTPTMTTAAFNVLNNGEKLSKKQRKKLAAAMNEAAMSKSSFNEGKPSHEKDDVEDDPTIAQGKTSSKANNILPIWGNEKTMNLNPLLLTNIQNSPYFKVSLYVLKTYHEVIDEIWNQVKHLEPWERGSRKVGGQTGMCGSVRGVGAGGIVSTPFCILYKLYTLRLTRKQVVGLLKHKDSPFIRALGFLYVRYTQPPENLWEWLSPYLEDDEVVDPKAGGGQKMTIGDLARHLLTKLEWFSTLFPRIPVPVQKEIEMRLNEHDRNKPRKGPPMEEGEVSGNEEEEQVSSRRKENRDDRKFSYREKWKHSDRLIDSSDRKRRSKSREKYRSKSSEKTRNRRSRSRSRSLDRRRRERDNKHEKRHRQRSDSREKSKHKSDKHRDY